MLAICWSGFRACSRSRIWPPDARRVRRVFFGAIFGPGPSLPPGMQFNLFLSPERIDDRNVFAEPKMKKGNECR